MANTVEVEVTREELDVVSDWLNCIMEGGDAEAEGRKYDDSKAGEASNLLADYAETEGDRGADIISVCRGVPLLVEVILEAEAQRMMEALMGACAGVIPPRKVGALRILVSMAKCERHRASISGSGVLGVVTAAAVGVKTPTKLRALCFEAVGVLSCDDDVETTTRYFDEKRAEEFVKLRKQVLAVRVLDAMSSCLEPTKATNKVTLCTAAADAIARLAPSTDVSEVLVRTNVVSKCLNMLKSAHLKMNEGGGGNKSDEEEEDDFDYCFAWERPALRVIVGILKYLSQVNNTENFHHAEAKTSSAILSAESMTDDARTNDNGNTNDNVNSDTSSGLSPLCEAVATVEMVKTILNVLKIGGGGRGEVQRLALDILRRLSHITLKQESIETPITITTDTDTGVITDAAAADTTVDSTVEVEGEGEGNVKGEEETSVTCAEYLLNKTKKGSELISNVRRLLVMSDEYTIISCLELLYKLSSTTSVSNQNKNVCMDDICKVWQEIILKSDILTPMARAIISSRDIVPTSTSTSSSSSLTCLSSSSFSTKNQHARPSSVLMASSLLLKNLTNNKKNVPGSLQEAAQNFLDSLVILSMDIKPMIRTDAISCLITVLHPTAQHLTVHSVCIEYIKECCLLTSSSTSSSSSRPTTSMIGGALRTIAESGDLAMNVRDMATELISIIDTSLASSSSSSSISISKNKNKNKKNKKNKNKSVISSASGGGGGGTLSGITENSITLKQSLQNEIDEVFNIQSQPSPSSSSADNENSKHVISSEAQEIQDILSLPHKLKQCGNIKFQSRLFIDATLFYEKVLSTLDDIVDNGGNDKEIDNDEDDNDDDNDGDEDNEDNDVSDNINDNLLNKAEDKSSNGDELKKESQLAVEVGVLKVACYLNQARCYLRLWQEDKCLAACAYAEAAASEAERVKVNQVCCFLKAQLWWQLSGCASDISTQKKLPVLPAKRKHYLCRARDVLSRSKGDKSSRQLLKSVNAALKSSV